MKKNKISVFSLLFVLGLFFISCTDLDERIYSDSNTSNFYNNRKEVLSAVLRPYTHSRATFGQTSRQNCWMMNEFSADQLAWPVKGPHGYDGGKWIQLHYHTWDDMHDAIKECWNLLFMGLGFCNDAVQSLDSYEASRMGITEAERLEYIAELRANRAYYYLNAMDVFGNVPIVTQVGEPLTPATNSRAEVFKFVEDEMLEVINQLPDMDYKNVGRFTKSAGYAILAELYLNAEVWTGTARWNDCITYCNKLLAGEGGSQHGKMQLDEDLVTTYCNQNTEKSNENILVLSYDYSSSGDRCGWSGHFYHFNQRYIYGGHSNGNDGVVVIPSAYDAFKDNDLRKQQWMLIGPQFHYDDPTKAVLGTSEYSGQPLVFVKEIKRFSEGGTESTMYTGEENSGARFNKYNPGPQSEPNYWNNDWVLYRLTEIYYMKAEALMRMNGNTATQEAVDLINATRQRAFLPEDWNAEKYTVATLTMDELLAERGREFIFEGKRRKDMIRFGKFLTTEWWDHKPTQSEHLNIFPIPYSQTMLNSNLIQNPGYSN
jgi:SusD family.